MGNGLSGGFSLPSNTPNDMIMTFLHSQTTILHTTECYIIDLELCHCFTEVNSGVVMLQSHDAEEQLQRDGTERGCPLQRCRGVRGDAGFGKAFLNQLTILLDLLNFELI